MIDMAKRIFKTINSRDEIPVFKNDAEEAKFWATHEMGEKMFENAGSDPLAGMTIERSRFRSGTEQTNIKLEIETKERLKRVAKAKGMPYQTLLKAFVLERLYEEEKRLGIVGK